MSQITLYHFPMSICSMKVRLCLAELAVPYEERIVDIGLALENLEPWYVRLNPRGVVPTLCDGNLVVTDSAKIMHYLAERFEAGLPQEPQQRAEVEHWVKVADTFPLHAISYSRGGIPRGDELLASRPERLFYFWPGSPSVSNCDFYRRALSRHCRRKWPTAFDEARAGNVATAAGQATAKAVEPPPEPNVCAPVHDRVDGRGVVGNKAAVSGSDQRKVTGGRKRIAVPWLTEILRPRRLLLDRITGHEPAQRLGFPRHDVDIHAQVPPVA